MRRGLLVENANSLLFEDYVGLLHFPELHLQVGFGEHTSVLKKPRRRSAPPSRSRVESPYRDPQTGECDHAGG